MLVTYTWDFPSHETLVQYCKDLFGMVLATEKQADAELQQALKVIDNKSSAQLEWCLVYAVGQMK